MNDNKAPKTETEQTSDFYDAEAEVYDKKRWSSPSGNRLNEFQLGLVTAMLSPLKGKKILEVGTGTGRFVATLAQKSAEATGVDISKGMLAVAEKRCAAISCDFPPQFKQSDGSSLPFPDGAYDAAFCVNVFQLFESPRAALDEINRVLKPDGQFLFNFPNILSPYMVGGLLVNLRGRATGKNEAGQRRSRWFTLGAIRRLLAGSFFEIVQVRGQPFIPGNLGLSAFQEGIAHLRCLCPSLFVSCARIDQK